MVIFLIVGGPTYLPYMSPNTGDPKRKVMMVNRTSEECKISVEGEEAEEVERLKYLGVTISGDGGCDDEIEQRIGAAARVVGAMRKEVLERRELQKKTKMGVFNAMVVPTLL